jgi:hypothetical protein
MTDVSFMNDPQEKELTREVLKLLNDTTELTEQYREAIKLHLNIELETFRKYALCLTCDSEENEVPNNELSQWKFYGDDGLGYALELNINSIRTQDNSFSHIASRINYVNNYADEAKFCIEKAISYLDNSQPIDEMELKHVAIGIARSILDYSCFVKLKIWEHEHEARILTTSFMLPDTSRTFIRKDSYFIPYKELKISNETLKSVTIGPKINQDLVKSTLKYYLLVSGFEVNVEHANCIYR